MKFFSFYIPTFVFAALNLVVLFLFLRHFLFKPVTQVMTNRTNSIKKAIDDAEKQKADALELKSKYEDQIKTAKEAAEKIIADATARAEKEKASIIDEARQEAEALLRKSREQIEVEHEQMLRDVKSHVAGIALAAASKVIEANMDTEANRILVDKFIDEAGAA